VDAIEIARGKLHIPKKGGGGGAIRGREKIERRGREREKRGSPGSFRGRRERSTLIAGNR